MNTQLPKSVKRQAGWDLNNAVAAGKLKRPNACESCGRVDKGQGKRALIEAHHEDYSKPLEVIWLCNPCHKKRHVAFVRALQREYINEVRYRLEQLEQEQS